jgi:hypothetical protein
MVGKTAEVCARGVSIKIIRFWGIPAMEVAAMAVSRDDEWVYMIVDFES